MADFRAEERMRTRKYWVALLLAGLALVAPSCRSGIVTYVVDGDTIDVDGRYSSRRVR